MDNALETKDYGPDESHCDGQQSVESLDSIHPVETPNSSRAVPVAKRGRISRELSPVSTHVSLGPDGPLENFPSTQEMPDEVYDKLSPGRKTIIVALLSFCSFLAPISSTTVLAATPEVAAEFGTTGAVINLSNAMYMLWMGISPVVWGPLSQVYGRRIVSS